MKFYLCIITIAVILLAIRIVPLRHGVNESRRVFDQTLCDEIIIGMTITEVEALLGVPPGDYSSRRCQRAPITTGASDEGWKHWISDEGEIVVLFNDAELVQDVTYKKVVILTELSLFEKIMRYVMKR